MKKLLYILGSVLLLLIIGYFSYGFYLNLRLEAYEEPNKTFGIKISQTDESYFSGICKEILDIYPWEEPSHQPFTSTDYYNHVKINCTIRQQPSMPFGFQYIRAFKNKREISTLLSFSQSPFWTVKKLFFNHPFTICLAGIDTPLPLKESIYKAGDWFSMRGLQYSIDLDDDLKVTWKAHIDNFFENNSFPKTANLIQGSSCQNYTDKDIIKKYPVVSKKGWW